MTQTATKKPEITANAIYRVTDKESGKECYMVPSDSQPGLFYKTCWNAEALRWDCTCKAGQHGQCCKHARAAQVVVLARKAQEQERKYQEEAERRAAFVAMFDPCGLGY